MGAHVGVVAALAAALLAGYLPGRPAQARLHPAVATLKAPPAGLTPASLTGPAPADGAEGVIRLQDLTPDQARLWNARNPIARLPNPAAKPFHLETEGVLEEARAVDCLTAAVYYEAGAESLEGQRAVAQVTLNRLRHPAFPKTVCGVVFQGAERASGCQFTFACDGSLGRTPSEAGWRQARTVAEAALHGYVMKAVGEATHYHAVYVAPYWSPTLVKVAAVGAHVFYRWTGTAGLPPAFAGTYAGGEASAVRVATLEKLAGASARSLPPAAQPVLQSAAPVQVAQAEPAAVAVASPSAAVVAQVAAPTPPAVDALAVVPSENLDWQGRPKPRAPPRLAMPSQGGGF